jgi:TetR/AcrR family transcriptional repressor of nem operon
MGRPSDARERLLDVACRLIGRHGYGGLGVAEICSAAGVPKGSFYYFFESKQGLSHAVIDMHWAAQREQWTAILSGDEAGAGPLLGRLRTLFEATAATQRQQQREAGSVTGCLFATLALELSAQDQDARLHLQRVFDEQVTLVAALVEQAVELGEIPAWIRPTPAAKSVVAQLEGVVLFAKLANDPSQLDDLWEQTLLLLGAHALGAQMTDQATKAPASQSAERS